MSADLFKQAHELVPGDKIATHYSTPKAVVLSRVTSQDETVLVISLPNAESVRYAVGTVGE